MILAREPCRSRIPCRMPHLLQRLAEADAAGWVAGLRWAHWRLQAPKFLRQTFVEWAGLSIPHCDWAKAFYDQQRARGSSHQAALRALAFKWIRILYRCWQTRTPYDESTYLNALKRRGSPLLISMAPIAKTS